MGDQFLHEIIRALPAHIAILDRSGRILMTSRSWEAFAAQNGAASSASVAVGANYLQVCRQAIELHDECAWRALEGIEAVLSGRSQSFEMEYPCHSPQEQRWFCMTVTGFTEAGEAGAVVAHTNITHQTVAAKEASHRAKNLLNLVQVIARQTMKSLQTTSRTFRNAYALLQPRKICLLNTTGAPYQLKNSSEGNWGISLTCLEIA